ncbi:hypothetical protein [Pseudomonas fluorescens]|uniref:hypothetical protein n=1 Tax=Pseudomonas fluorescens TaxID=294 RepID=UPI00130E52C9|nr:hypothetical protein [Pseudomonas fluorescens]
MKLGIWFEDTTSSPERVFVPGAAPSSGMRKEWFDAVLGAAKASQHRYTEEGMLSAVLVDICPDHYEQFEAVLRNVGQLLGTNPWVRDLANPHYANVWYSRRPFFKSPSEKEQPPMA